MKLSILIPYTEDRHQMTRNLMDKLLFSCPDEYLDEIEIITDSRSKHTSIGTKRNSLLSEAKGEYVCFVDSDDDIHPKYAELLLEGIAKGADCCSLKGIMTTDGKNPEIFEHSLAYHEWATIGSATGEQVKYIRTINHLNCVKSSIAKQFKFPEKNFGEDHVWSKALHASGLLRTEHYIEPILYYYLYKSKK